MTHPLAAPLSSITVVLMLGLNELLRDDGKSKAETRLLTQTQTERCFTLIAVCVDGVLLLFNNVQTY